LINESISFFVTELPEIGIVRRARTSFLRSFAEKQTGATAIIRSMARGWESKSIEAQQEDAAAAVTPGKPRLTGEEAAQVREKENLRLSLRRVSEQLKSCSDPRRRSMLERAQIDLERRLGQFQQKVELLDQSVR
jgi:hypothetical protein